MLSLKRDITIIQYFDILLIEYLPEVELLPLTSLTIFKFLMVAIRYILLIIGLNLSGKMSLVQCGRGNLFSCYNQE